MRRDGKGAVFATLRSAPMGLHQWVYFSVKFSLTPHGGVDIINTSRKDDFIDFEERRAAMALQAARKEAVSDKRC